MCSFGGVTMILMILSVIHEQSSWITQRTICLFIHRLLVCDMCICWSIEFMCICWSIEFIPFVRQVLVTWYFFQALWLDLTLLTICIPPLETGFLVQNHCLPKPWTRLWRYLSLRNHPLFSYSGACTVCVTTEFLTILMFHYAVKSCALCAEGTHKERVATVFFRAHRTIFIISELWRDIQQSNHLVCWWHKCVPCDHPQDLRGKSDNKAHKWCNFHFQSQDRSTVFEGKCSSTIIFSWTLWENSIVQ